MHSTRTGWNFRVGQPEPPVRDREPAESSRIESFPLAGLLLTKQLVASTEVSVPITCGIWRDRRLVITKLLRGEPSAENCSRCTAQSLRLAVRKFGESTA